MKEIKTPILKIGIPIALIVILGILAVIFVILNPISLGLALPVLGLACICSPILIIIAVVIGIIYFLFLRGK